MKKLITLITLTSLMMVSGFAIAQDGARPGSQSDTTPPQQNSGAANEEDFADVLGLLAGDWDSVNTSDDPAGAASPEWFQGNPAVFLAQSGADDAYAANNFNATGGSQISSWLLVPDVGFMQEANFFTRTVTGNTFPDRMQVRFSDVGGTNVGTDPATVGDYGTLLLDINPNLDMGGYPDDWAPFTVNPNASGRLAFRYFVDVDAGPVGSNSNFIGVDTFSFVLGSPLPPAPAVPTLGVFGLLALALLLVLGTFVAKRRQSI